MHKWTIYFTNVKWGNNNNLNEDEEDEIVWNLGAYNYYIKYNFNT